MFNMFNKNGNTNGVLPRSLLPRVEYFRILLNSCAKLIITSMHLNNSIDISEIAKILSKIEEAVENKEKTILQDARRVADSYEKSPSEELKQEFDKYAQSLSEFIEQNLVAAIGENEANILLKCASQTFFQIKNMDLTSSKSELARLEMDLNAKVQAQLKTLSGYWAKEKLQILYFIYISQRELHHLFFRMDYHYETKDTCFQPCVDQIRSKLMDLERQILFWPSIFEARQIFKSFLIEIAKLKAKTNYNYNGQQFLLLNVLEDIINRAVEILASFDKRQYTAKSLLNMAQERLDLAMSDINQMESFIRSAIAFHQQCKSPQIIPPEEAEKAENFATFLPQKGNAIYGMEGSDVTVGCLSSDRKLCVIGDTHGEMHFAKPEVFPEESSKTYVFLGDSTDRGVYIESTLLPLMLQQIDPQNFLIILGNHEYDIAKTMRNNGKGFISQIKGEEINLPLFDKYVLLPVLPNIINQSDDETKERFFALFKELFNLFPTAVVNENYFLVHGGLILEAANVASVFANSREFMVAAKYCQQLQEREIDTTGRPAFGQSTIGNLIKMGYKLGCGHQHEQNDYESVFEVNTNLCTNPAETPQVVVLDGLNYRRDDIECDLALFPATIVLQQYLCEIAREARFKIFEVFDQNLFNEVKEQVTLLKTILLYSYACIQTDSQELKNKPEIMGFFQSLANAEADAFKRLKDEYYKLDLFTQSINASLPNVEYWFDMKRGAGAMTQIIKGEVLNSFTRMINEQDQQYKQLENEMTTNFLQFIKGCPLQLRNFIYAELPYIQNVIQEKTTSLLNIKLRCQESMLKDLLEKLEVKVSLINHLKEKITEKLSEMDTDEDIIKCLNNFKTECVNFSNLTERGNELIQEVDQSQLQEGEKVNLIDGFLDEVLNLVKPQYSDRGTLIQQAAENFKTKLHQEISNTNEAIEMIQEKIGSTNQQIPKFFEQIRAKFTTTSSSCSAFFPIVRKRGFAQEADATTRPRAASV